MKSGFPHADADAWQSLLVSTVPSATAGTPSILLCLSNQKQLLPGQSCRISLQSVLLPDF